jgi:HEAT repeat protein
MSPRGSSGRESSGVANGWGEPTGSDERAADDLLKDLEDFDPSVRLTALHALERLLAREGAVRRLCAELASSACRRRRASLQALAQLEAVEAGSEVWRLADDPDPEVRLSLLRSANALLVDPEPLIRYMSTDPDPLVRESAQEWRRNCRLR